MEKNRNTWYGSGFLEPGRRDSHRHSFKIDKPMLHDTIFQFEGEEKNQGGEIGSVGGWKGKRKKYELAVLPNALDISDDSYKRKEKEIEIPLYILLQQFLSNSILESYSHFVTRWNTKYQNVNISSCRTCHSSLKIFFEGNQEREREGRKSENDMKYLRWSVLRRKQDKSFKDG